MSDSYVLTPSNPNVDNYGFFNLVYTTTSISAGESATYNLVNTSNNNTTIKSIVGTANPFLSKVFYVNYGYVTGYQPFAVYALPNQNIWLDFNNSNASFPYNVVYDPSGTRILENRDISNALTFAITSDASYLYGFTSNHLMNKYTLDGSYVRGSTINIGAGFTSGQYFNGAAYCPVDDFIYATQNAAASSIYKINKTTGAKTLFTTVTSDSLGIAALVFNSDYSYMYYIFRNTGTIYYVNRTNPSDKGVLTIANVGGNATLGSGTSMALTCDMSANVLYSCLDGVGAYIYMFKLVTPTTCEPRQIAFTLTNDSTRNLHYSNITNKLYVSSRTYKYIYTLTQPITDISFINVPNRLLANGQNTLQIKRNGINFGNSNPISFNTNLSIASDSYVLTPSSNPNINGLNTSFTVTYTTTEQLPVSDPGTYDLTNTSNNTLMKKVTIPFKTIQVTDFSYSNIPTFNPFVVYSLPNGNMWVDFRNTTDTTYPYSVVYNTSGTKILENRDISDTYAMTSDGTYLYGFRPGAMSRYTLEGEFIQGSTVSTGQTFIAADYCPIDGYLYASTFGMPNAIYKIDKNTGVSTLFKTTPNQTSAGIRGLSFNSDYSYMYFANVNQGALYYVQRTNSANIGIVQTTANVNATFGNWYTSSMTMCRKSNVLYGSTKDTYSVIYYLKLITPTRCEPYKACFSLSANVTNAIHYSNETNQLLIANNTLKQFYILQPISSAYTVLSYSNILNGTLFNGDNTIRTQRSGINVGNNSLVFNTARTSDAYTVTPLTPTLSELETFDVVYISDSYQLADDASYSLLNTTTGSVITTIRKPASSFTTRFINELVTPNIYSLPNNNIFVSFGNSASPYNIIYYENGTESPDTPYNQFRYDIYGMVSDGTYIYAILAYSISRYNLAGVRVSGVLPYNSWMLGSDYNPNDKCIYGAVNGASIYKVDISNSTQANEVGGGVTGSGVSNLSSTFKGLAFNSNYSYMYVCQSDGDIRYFQFSNAANNAVITNIGADANKITCNRNKNILYVCSPSTPYVYAIKLITNTTCLQPYKAFTLSAGSSSLYYNNSTNKLFVVDNNRRVYICNDDSALSFLTMPCNSLVGGTNILNIQRNGVNFGNPITVNATCFLEGTRILCLTDTYEEEYVKIENIKQGMLVKTYLHGFKPVHSIGKGTLYNPNEKTLTHDRLYVISKNKCSDLMDDLCITGNHSVLVPSITDEQREKIVENMKEIYITDDQYRLPACLDDRFTEFVDSGNKTIWHFALENDDIFGNYGVYANGLLVETCSIRYLTELSTFELQ